MRTGRHSTNAVVIALLFSLLCCVPASAKRRALIVGINQYENPADLRAWQSLEGAVNDAIRMQDVLASRFGFERGAMQVLLDKQAGRDAILRALEDLIATSARGDVVVVYFSGHGSRVRNSLSREPDRLDESIVPADGPAGAHDIRDKELRDRFNRLLNAGVVLTAIFDSCHSGSIARGPLGSPSARVRMLPIDTRDAMDASQAPNPADLGALILSASQDDEVAYEHVDAFGRPGGLFTIALGRALVAAEPGESAMNVFRRTFAYMRDTGRAQSPVIEGSPERRATPLFGLADLNEIQRLTVAVEAVNADEIVIQQGIAAGLTAGTELVMAANNAVRLRVSRVTGLASSISQVVSGSAAQIHPGDLFAVDKWASPAVPDLRLFASTTDSSAQVLIRLQGQLRNVIRSRGHQWVADPTQTIPTHVVTYENESWWLIRPAGERRSLGKLLTERKLINALGRDARRGLSVFVNLPLPNALRRAIQLGPNAANSAVAWAGPQVADYHLMGRVDGGHLTFAWVRPWQAGNDGALPQKSDWVGTNDADVSRAGSRLTTLAARLARVNAWLNLEAPPATDGAFPYRLALKRQSSSDRIDGGTVYEGEQFDVVLIADRTPVAAVARRFVYVFAIDAHGMSQLIGPRSGAVENRFPRESDTPPAPAYVLPDSGFSIDAPFGTDTFFMLTSSEQLPDPWVLQWEGARSRSGDTPADSSPLGRLLSHLGSPTRGELVMKLPENWNIQRLSVQTRARQ
jgi:hypothetical protein